MIYKSHVLPKPSNGILWFLSFVRSRRTKGYTSLHIGLQHTRTIFKKKSTSYFFSPLIFWSCSETACTQYSFKFSFAACQYHFRKKATVENWGVAVGDLFQCRTVPNSPLYPPPPPPQTKPVHQKEKRKLQLTR